MWNIVAHIESFVVVFFFTKTKKMIFLEVTMTIIGENTLTKCVWCV